ncbi:HEAT repeat domain-containing protein [Halomontanus rarus]|uniref:HEAT repeat domain-containing protein n=1 Tax=Halomontanus rarus TaxID=3034020 RepID=UPI0023E82A7A|nr:HEAT repeat domain-containing protein [Halovivax sp. TS33]
MDEPGHSPPKAYLTELIDENAHEEAAAYLGHFETADADDRKRVLQALRSLAADRPTAVAPLLEALAPFLTDDERAVRLTTVKLFVTVAETDPEAVVRFVSPLGDRLADDDEFYYIRARAAEALGFAALENPDAVASPETLADLRVGLRFEDAEVRVKLAKALEYVALGDPHRLRNHVSSLADHLGDDDELVRYHLCTALTVIGCEYPDALTDARAELVDRLDDENAYVRGRALEGLGVLLRAESTDAVLPETALEGLEDDEESFVAERARFAVSAPDRSDDDSGTNDGIGSGEAIRETTGEILEELTSPDGDGECPHCGLELPEHGPPMCPRCGAPY